MKKQLLFLFAALLPLVASAEKVEIDGIWYNLIKKVKTAEVTSGGNYSGSITLPATVTYDGVTYSVTSIGSEAFAYCSSLTAITLPESVTSIGNYAFAYCRSLTAITIPGGVTSIGNSAFWDCSSLTAITIPEGVTSIGSGAFYGCSSLTAITLPEGVTSIGGSAFAYCSSLTSITIPEGVTSIGSEAFSGCSSLTSITFPKGVTSIAYATFYGCSSLTAITLPESVTSIGGSAFYGCSSLTTIVLPKSVKDIYNEAFAGCSELTDVYCHAEKVPDTEADAFNGSYIEYVTLHVPASAMNDYKTTAPWSGFGTLKTIENVTLEKCATPTISYIDGKVVFACDTEGAIVKSNFMDNNASDYADSEVSFIPTYTITAYATKAQYEDSDVATATLCWIACDEEAEEPGEGIIHIPSKAVLISTQGGILTLSGLADGTEVAVYSTAGMQLATATATDGTAILNTGLTEGSIVVVKIGYNSMKVTVR